MTGCDNSARPYLHPVRVTGPPDAELCVFPTEHVGLRHGQRHQEPGVGERRRAPLPENPLPTLDAQGHPRRASGGFEPRRLPEAVGHVPEWHPRVDAAGVTCLTMELRMLEIAETFV